MSAMLRCPNCQQENQPHTRFCGNCGQSLTVKCTFCGTENSLGIKFCQQCGNELGTAKPGLTYDRAKAFRDVFRAINSNYVQWQKFKKEEWDAIRGQGLPDPEDKLEPWVFGCRGEMSNFMPEGFSVSSQAVKKGFLGVETHQTSEFAFPGASLIIATRCRMALFLLRKKPFSAHVWPYTDFQKYEIPQSKTAVQVYVSDKIIQIPFKVPSAGLFDFAMMHSDDPIVRGATVVRTQAKNENKATFMQAIDRFFADIMEVSKANAG